MPGGRPRLPNRIKELRGNPGGRPIPPEPYYPSTGLTCPAWLPPEAKKEWRRVARLLTAARVATAPDRGAMAAYCVSWARWADAERDISAHGTVQQIPILDKGGHVVGVRETPRPIVAQAMGYQKLMMAAAGRLGMTPSDRSKVSATEEPEQTLAELLIETWQVAEDLIEDPVAEMRLADLAGLGAENA